MDAFNVWFESEFALHRLVLVYNAPSVCSVSKIPIPKVVLSTRHVYRDLLCISSLLCTAASLLAMEPPASFQFARHSTPASLATFFCKVTSATLVRMLQDILNFGSSLLPSAWGHFFAQLFILILFYILGYETLPFTFPLFSVVSSVLAADRWLDGEAGRIIWLGLDWKIILPRS